MELVKCTALVEFNRYVDGYGMIVGSPDSTLDEAKNPMVPEAVLATFVDDGLVSTGEPEKPAKAVKAEAAATEAP